MKKLLLLALSSTLLLTPACFHRNKKVVVDETIVVRKIERVSGPDGWDIAETDFEEDFTEDLK